MRFIRRLLLCGIAPVVWLPYPIALLASSVLGLGFFAAGIGCLVQFFRLQSEPDFERLVLFCLGFLPLLATLLQGQLTSVVFLFLTLAFIDLKRARDFRAGIWLALSLAKFKTIPVFLFILLLKKRWKAFLGFLVVGWSLALISLLVVGLQGCWTYFKLLSERPTWVDLYGLNPVDAQCIRGQMFQLFHLGWPSLVVPLTILFDAILVILLLRFWRGEWNPNSHLFDVRFAVMIIAAVLVAPHVNFHDLAFPIQINVVAMLVLVGLAMSAVQSKRLLTTVGPGS